MKFGGKWLALACLVAATGSAAQGVKATQPAPSAVTDVTPYTQLLAGKLFFSQQQRDQMDRARKLGAIAADSATLEPAPSVLNGFVKRSDGISTVWVDSTYKLMTDSGMAAQILPTSVGMDTPTITASEPAAADKSSSQQRPTAPGKNRKPGRASDSAAVPSRK